MPADVVDRPSSMTPAPPRSGPTAPALGKHEGIARNRPFADAAEPVGGCPRWPEGMWLLAQQTGELVRGRCKATNQCDYCAKLGALENTEVLRLDATLGRKPTVLLVLGSRSTDLNPAAFRQTRQQLVSALRREWPGLEFAWMWELTTGYGPRSGGKRRLHGNVVLKMPPPERPVNASGPTDCRTQGFGEEDSRAGSTPAKTRSAELRSGQRAEVVDLTSQDAILDRVRAIVERHWCRREDALIEHQYVGVIRDMPALMGYIGAHFQKESQAPPKGWRGHRFQTSRGYLWTSTPLAREAARESLRFKRELWRAQKAGVQGEERVDVAKAAIEKAKKISWRIFYRKPAGEIRPGDTPVAVGISDARRIELVEEHYLRELLFLKQRSLVPA